MDNGRGVITINYINSEISSSALTRIPNNIFFNVYEASFLGDANMVSFLLSTSDAADELTRFTHL
mgnify:CR=1 FL=1